jgi:uncharacterized protein (DUF58 family)
VTLRGGGTSLGAVGLVVVGWRTGWPELSALGAAALTLVVVSIVLAGSRPRASLALDRASLRVVRGEAAWARLTVAPGGRRRWMRVVEGAVNLPSRSLGLPAKDRSAETAVKVPLDTARRGQHPVGPYSIVHGDPWSITRRTLAQTEQGTVTVLPRTYPVERSLLTSMSIEDTMLTSRRPGDHHFHALRDYVLGDEPRMVHWRSSARAGHLVVRQQLAAATNGTTVVLDCDGSAYGSDEQFGSGWLDDRFEAAVEVAASIIVADLGRREQVHLVPSTRGAATVTAPAGSPASCLDLLAIVQAVAPVETSPDDVPQAVRRTRCARAIIITGTPRPATVDAARRISRSGTATLVIRVGTRARTGLAGLQVVDVEQPDELSARLQ